MFCVGIDIILNFFVIKFLLCLIYESREFEVSFGKFYDIIFGKFLEYD